MIDYTLESNEVIKEQNKFRAQVINSRSYTFDDIANYLIKHNVGLSLPAIHGVWEGIKAAVEEYLSNGGIINTELFLVSTSIKGVFDGTDDSFDPKRHEVRLRLRAGQFLRDTPRKLKVKKQVPSAKILIQSVTDIKTGSVNSNLTPGKNIRIKGSRLRISGADPSCGLYFVPEKATDATVKIEPSEFVVNDPKQIIAVIPSLKKGRWNLRLVSQYSRGNKSLKEPHGVTFDKVLTVA
jgi:hypothetical protein